MSVAFVSACCCAVALVAFLGHPVAGRRLDDHWNRPTIVSRADTDADLFPVSLIHWNDFHARFEETNERSTGCRAGEKCIGGYARHVAAVKRMQLDRAATNPVYLNAGDNFQGTLWYNIGRWNVTQEFLNMLPADAITLGNHEFDHQVSGVVPFMDAIRPFTPFVIANLDDSGEPTIQGKYQKSIVIERYARKIGIVGVMLATTNTIADTGNLKFLDEATSVRAEAAALRARGVDIIIVLSHSGLDVDKIIARDAGPDIDVIVGGHSHTFMYTGADYPGPNRPGDSYPAIVQQPDSDHSVLIVQAGAYTRYLGDLTVWFDAAGQVVRWQGQPIYLDDRIEPDATVAAAILPWKERIDEAGVRVVGRTAVNLVRSGCDSGECNMGSFLADAFAHAWVGHASSEHWTHAPIAIHAVGGIRTSLNRGEITFADLAAVAPFENTVDVVELRGDHLLEVLEYSATKSWQEDRFSGAHLVQISGMKLVLDVGRPAGQRVVSVDLLCRKCAVPTYAPLNRTEVYNVVVGSYLATGGDGFDVVKKHGKNRQIGPVDIDAISAYVERMSPIMAGLDGRLTVIHPAK